MTYEKLKGYVEAQKLGLTGPGPVLLSPTTVGRVVERWRTAYLAEWQRSAVPNTAPTTEAVDLLTEKVREGLSSLRRRRHVMLDQEAVRRLAPHLIEQHALARATKRHWRWHGWHAGPPASAGVPPRAGRPTSAEPLSGDHQSLRRHALPPRKAQDPEVGGSSGHPDPQGGMGEVCDPVQLGSTGFREEPGGRRPQPHGCRK